MGRSGRGGKDSEDDSSNDEEQRGRRYGSRSRYDVQRAKLDKLMKDPSKPAFIPAPKKEKDVNKAADFVYNVMGSSAGAGSGEFHVYRQIRRKEFERQRVIEARKTADDLNEAYHLKLEENERESAEKTSKKRAKRLQKKENAKRKKLELKNEVTKEEQGEEKNITETTE